LGSRWISKLVVPICHGGGVGYISYERETHARPNMSKPQKHTSPRSKRAEGEGAKKKLSQKTDDLEKTKKKVGNNSS